jgi:protein-tyrosine phosphatase
MGSSSKGCFKEVFEESRFSGKAALPGNPKLEARNPRQIRSTKTEIENALSGRGFELRISCLFRISMFGFRVPPLVMLDLHCHILPGVDDGAASLDEALAMAQLCVRDGITHIAATPHCHGFLRLFRSEILPHVVRLNEDLGRAGVPLTILPGSEVQVTDTAEYRADFEAGRYCHLGDGGAFTLLEFSWKSHLYPPEAPELIAWLRARGMTPIVAHPERHGYFAEDPERLRALVDAGAWLQVTVDSLLGKHGPVPQSLGPELLRKYPDCVLASDAHNLRRCSGLSAGYAWVAEQLGLPRSEEVRARADQVLSALHP